MTDASTLQGELEGLNAELVILGQRATEAQQAWVEADSAYRATAQRRDDVAARLRAAMLPAPAVPTAPPAPGTMPETFAPAGPAGAAPGRVREASTRTVQNILFVLGGILLGTAAIVFTAVAWTTFGVAGRASILAIVTLVMLALPFVALWRTLRATAETFAAVGLLLVVLDGWAAWSVNLFGVTSLGPTRYAGLVCAVTAAIALGYRTATHLVGPGFVGLLALQPVLPLLAADERPTLAGWSLLFSGVAALNLPVVWRHRDHPEMYRRALRVTAWVLTGVALSLAVLIALADLQLTGRTAAATALGSVALVAAAAVSLAAAGLSRAPGFLTVSAAGLVLAGAGGAIRVLAVADGDRLLVWSGAVVAVVAVLGAALAAALPDAIRLGVRIGSLIAAGAVGAVTAGMALGAGAHTLTRAWRPWSAALTGEVWFSWQLPVTLVLVAAALAIAWRGGAGIIAVAAIGLVVLALPDSFVLTWWAPAAIDLAAATSLVAFASTVYGAGPARSRLAWTSAFGALALGGHAVLASLSRPGLTAAILTGLVVVGAALAAGPALRRDEAGVGLRAGLAWAGEFIALAALPPAVGAWLTTAEVVPWWAWRLTVVAVFVVVAVVGARRTWPAFAAALVGAMVWPAAAGLSGVEPLGVYAGAGLLAIAAAAVAIGPERSRPGSGGMVSAGLAACPGLLLLAVAVVEPVLAVVAVPYTWLVSIWSGATAGTGLLPAGVLPPGFGPDTTGESAVALGLLALASAVATFALTRRVRRSLAGLAIGGPAAILVGLAAARAAWPALPATTLLIGLLAFGAAAVWSTVRWRTSVLAIQGVAYVGAGLAGLLAERWSTLAGLGLTVVALAVIGQAGRTVAWRVVGAVGAVAFALTLAAAAGLAADLPLRSASFGVLAVAMLALAAGAWVGGPVPGDDREAGPGQSVGVRRRPEGAAIEVAAHAGAIVALLFTVGSAGYPAALCAAWGVAVGLRALWPGTGRAARAGLAALAATFELVGWWLLLAARDVALLEAYTLPLAGVALLAGFAALRSRPELRSWLAYGPALAAAFLPTLATVIVTTGDPGRRLALGVGALAVVIGGAVRRRQAPVVVGGGVLIVLAIHEVAIWWQRTPGWIPLAVGGVLLVGLAITYERRLRDLQRLRSSLSRMT